MYSSSGSVFTVDHPENCAILNNFVAIALADGESFVMPSFLHITAVKGSRGTDRSLNGASVCLCERRYSGAIASD